LHGRAVRTLLQNHGYQVDTDTLPSGWKELFENANDGSNEGIYCEDKPFFSVQFHPESTAGPRDTEFLFDVFLQRVEDCAVTGSMDAIPMPGGKKEDNEKRVPRSNVSKVIILGPGGLTIGQAGEFDYSGSQVIKALKEEGIYTIMVNPNIATIATSKGLAQRRQGLFSPPRICSQDYQIRDRWYLHYLRWADCLKRWYRLEGRIRGARGRGPWHTYSDNHHYRRGYPLSFIAAKLGLGIPFNEIKNSVTKVTSAFFEPSLDYVVVKIPRWDLKIFNRVSRLLSSSMKSVGELMSIGRTFEETIRAIDDQFSGFAKVCFTIFIFIFCFDAAFSRMTS